jgi:hypothetical protein
MVAAGITGVVISTVAVWRSASRIQVAIDDPTTRRVPDLAAYASLIASVSALLTVVLIQFVWPHFDSILASGPCDQNPSVACFHGHPDYYQEYAPGSFTTPASRIGDYILTPMVIAAWPLALLAAATGVCALAFRTRRRYVAVVAAIVGLVTVVGMAVGYVALLVVGAGE